MLLKYQLCSDHRVVGWNTPTLISDSMPTLESNYAHSSFERQVVVQSQKSDAHPLCLPEKDWNSSRKYTVKEVRQIKAGMNLLCHCRVHDRRLWMLYALHVCIFVCEITWHSTSSSLQITG